MPETISRPSRNCEHYREAQGPSAEKEKAELSAPLHPFWNLSPFCVLSHGRLRVMARPIAAAR